MNDIRFEAGPPPRAPTTGEEEEGDYATSFTETSSVSLACPLPVPMHVVRKNPLLASNPPLTQTKRARSCGKLSLIVSSFVQRLGLSMMTIVRALI